MASQQAQIALTIAGLKSKLSHEARDDSDSDELTRSSRTYNRKRKIIYTRGGPKDGPNQRPAWKKRITHAGYHRYIIHRNPPKIDIDGDIIEDYDEEEISGSDASLAEEDPYAQIKLENLLAPLTQAAALTDHPTLSLPYKSNHLTTLTEEIGAICRKEKEPLWQAKQVFLLLRGDNKFAPAGVDDYDFEKNFMTGFEYSEIGPTDPASSLNHTQQSLSWWKKPAVLSNGGSPKPPSIMSVDNASQLPNGDAISAHEGPRNIQSLELAVNGQKVAESTLQLPQKEDRDKEEFSGAHLLSQQSIVANGTSASVADTSSTIVDGDASMTDAQTQAEMGNQIVSNTEENGEGDGASDAASHQTAHRMTTRARAHANSNPPSPASPSTPPRIHPFFEFPAPILPDTDFGLPREEAEETRHYLLAFTQKYEEIVRHSEELHASMLRADRMRREVFKWAKAEGHVGEMSDGEDWYDKEEWGLEEDLVKGKDEDEEDARDQGKKTRQRRAREDR